MSLRSFAFGTSSHPARGAWIEMKNNLPDNIKPESHPARGAWIEIMSHPCQNEQSSVAPRKGCVD